MVADRTIDDRPNKHVTAARTEDPRWEKCTSEWMET